MKKRIIIPIKDKPMALEKADGDGKSVSKKEKAIDMIRGLYKAMSNENISVFHTMHLAVVDIGTYEQACIHLYKTSTSMKAATYILTELNKFLEEVNKPIGELMKGKDISEEPEKEIKEKVKKDSPAPLEELLKDTSKFETLMNEALKEFGGESKDSSKPASTNSEGIGKDIEDIKNSIKINFKDVSEIKDKIKKMEQKEVATEFTIKYDSPKEPKKMEGVFPDQWEAILQLTTSRINTLLIGPAGCGKTYTGSLVAEALGLGFFSQSCSEGLDESVFAGVLLPIGENGTFEYLPSKFVDFYENGGVYLIDELDAADSNLLIFINTALSADKFYINRRWKNPLVIKHPDFICIAAANTFGNGGDELYIRNQLDGATLDRFKAGTVLMDYSERIEKKIVQPDIYSWGYVVRQGIKDLKLNKIMSTRVLADYTKLWHQHKWGIEEIRNSYFLGWNTDDLKRLENWTKEQAKKGGMNENDLPF